MDLYLKRRDWGKYKGFSIVKILIKLLMTVRFLHTVGLLEIQSNIEKYMPAPP